MFGLVVWVAAKLGAEHGEVVGDGRFHFRAAPVFSHADSVNHFRRKSRNFRFLVVLDLREALTLSCHGGGEGNPCPQRSDLTGSAAAH